LFALLAASACAAPSAGRVRGQFAFDNTCPESRVTVTERPAISEAAALTLAHPPPDDVSEDPERLALWRAEYRLEDVHVYELHGCDVDSDVVCGVHRGVRHPVECTTVHKETPYARKADSERREMERWLEEAKPNLLGAP
jgi:hypothetical protein